MLRRMLVIAATAIAALAPRERWDQAGWTWGQTKDNISESVLGAKNIGGVSSGVRP